MSKFKGSRLCKDCPECGTIKYECEFTGLEMLYPKSWCNAYKVRTSEESCCQDIYNKYKGIDG